MQQADIIAIANVDNSLRQLGDLHKLFLAHARSHSIPSDIPTVLQVGEDSISIECFGHLASAKPRPVRIAGNSYFMEYVFTAPLGDESHEVMRFYLSENGHLLASPSAQQSICDYNSKYVARHLCGRALLGAIASPILQPRKAKTEA